MSLSESVVAIGSIETLAGPLMVMVCFAFILYGVFLAQLLYYWTTYDSDGFLVKLWVVALGIFETGHTALCIHILYFYFITHFGDPVHGLEQIVWSGGTSVYFEVIIIGLAQSFYVYRIWHLSRRNIAVTGIVGAILTLRIAFGLFTTSSMFKRRTWEALQTSRLVLVTTNCTWGLSVLVDLLITLVLLYYLYSNRKSGLDRTKNIIRELMHYSISTGALTVFFSLVILISFNAYSQSLLFGGVLEVLSKLYANSMLAMLNARRRVFTNATGGGKNTIELSQLRWTPASASIDSPTTPNVVTIYKETTEFTDDMPGDMPHRMEKRPEDLSFA
ncbi:hypothetical protein BDW22DRAFT_1428601 [Trametopsis cervina]|nr:hypothetical protein BDW22DRAFT_1428601 [Trametopsis cervina]